MHSSTGWVVRDHGRVVVDGIGFGIGVVHIVRAVRCSLGSVTGRGHRILEIQVAHVLVAVLLVVKQAVRNTHALGGVRGFGVRVEHHVVDLEASFAAAFDRRAQM